MQIPKPIDTDKERLMELVPDGPGAELKPMFGNLGVCVNGNMFIGPFGSDIGVKTPDDERAKLLAQAGSGPFGPEERRRGGYATLPAVWTARKASPWIDKALAYAGALPPKTRRKRAAAQPAKKPKA